MWVWRLFPNRVGTKLSPRKEGPYLVLSMVSPLNVLIQKRGARQHLVHINDIEEAFGFENETKFKKWIKPRKGVDPPLLLTHAPDPILLLSVSEQSCDTDSDTCMPVVEPHVPKSSEGEEGCMLEASVSESSETSANPIPSSSEEQCTKAVAESRHSEQEEPNEADTVGNAEVCRAVSKDTGPVTRSRSKVHGSRKARTARSMYAEVLI